MTTTEPRSVTVGDVELAYETFGRATDRPMLLVMGLGTQMIAWPDPFCAMLADAGRYVVRFDNRDAGLSTHFPHLRVPSPTSVLARRSRPPYSIDDMATDTLGLLDSLGLDVIDLVGISMGGYISQALALRAPERLRSLTLMMTTTGSRRVGQPALKAAVPLIRRRPLHGRDAVIEGVLDTFQLIGSPGYPLDEERLRDVAGRSFDRGYDPRGYGRQLAACVGQPDRTSRLRRLTVPTLVVHGMQDPLVSVSGGLALARTIPGAKFVGHQGMGHDLPRALWPDLAADILRLP